jgi:Ty3 transposon capsid-like protein
MSSLPSSSSSSASAAAISPEVELAQLKQQMSQMYQAYQSMQQQISAQAASSPKPSGPYLKAPPVEQFSGEMGTAVTTFLTSVKANIDYCAKQYPTDDHRIAAAALYFKGAARIWWDKVDKSTITTWDEFVTALHERYRPKLAAEVARQQIAMLKQRGNVNSLCNRLLLLVADVPTMHEEDRIFHFKNALDRPIAAKVAEAKPKTLDEAMYAAVQAEMYVGRNAGFTSYPQSRSSTSGGHSTSVPMDLNAINEEQGFAPEVDEVEEKYSNVAPSRSGGTSDLAQSALMSKLDSMEQRLNALFQRGTTGSNPAAGNRDRIQGLKPGDISRLRAEGRCFRCGQKGHMKNDPSCPKRPKRPLFG